MKLSLLVIVIVIGIGLYAWGHSQRICEMRDGKWASVQSKCITRSCYLTKSCGEWANPGMYCKKLKLGDDISEVYFQLGDPITTGENTYIWPVGKAETGKIKATFENNKLKTLNCNAT